jgi:flagellar biosynthetic protein FliQ
LSTVFSGFEERCKNTTPYRFAIENIYPDKMLQEKAMSPEFVIGFARQSIELALFMALPMLGIGLAVGVIVSIIQAATQVQEMTLTFIPKVLSIFIALLLAFPWLMDKMISFTHNLFVNIPTYIR